MDKLSKYNQKLLAIIGTIILAGFGLLILIGAGVLVFELSRDYDNQRIRDNTLTIELKSDSVTEFNNKVRNQEVTFETLRLIDSLNSIYVIPISQVNLMDSEGINEILDFNESRKIRYGRNRYTGTYNNIIVYHQKKRRNTLVFNDKINVSSFQDYVIKGIQYLLIEGAKIDSNKDKKLNNTDLKSFFSYNILSGELNEFTFKDMGLVDYYVTYDSDEIILRYAKDKDINGEINEYQEPIYAKKLTLSDYKIYDLVDQKMVDKIQNLID
jgi:hypothetical protein